MDSIRRASLLVVLAHPDDEVFPGLLMVGLSGRIFFMNAEIVMSKIRTILREARPKVVVFHMSGVFDLEYTAVKMMTDAERMARENGVTIWVSGLNPAVKNVVLRSPLGEALGRERILHNLEEAVTRYTNESKGTLKVETGEIEPVLVG